MTIFNLKCLIDSVLNSRKKLFCAFIDFRKAFDIVYKVDASMLYLVCTNQLNHAYL